MKGANANIISSQLLNKKETTKVYKPLKFADYVRCRIYPETLSLNISLTEKDKFFPVKTSIK